MNHIMNLFNGENRFCKTYQELYKAQNEHQKHEQNGYHPMASNIVLD